MNTLKLHTPRKIDGENKVEVLNNALQAQILGQKIAKKKAANLKKLAANTGTCD